MEIYNEVSRISSSKHTIEGAGVHLKRAFGYDEVPLFDPFLLLDDFHSEDPKDYLAGFPWHPHRGIETVTYMIHGVIEHGDNIGNSGAIRDGDVQWMTAGSGIIHQEMPQKTKGMMQGFQLWVNLPAKNKMMNPRYRDVQKDVIPEVILGNGVKIKVISGKINDIIGPVRDIIVDIEYLDVNIPPNTEFEHKMKKLHNSFAYVFEGMGYIGDEKKSPIKKEKLVLFGEGNILKIKTEQENFRFLLVSGEPIREPVAWGGPIVMNTDEELDLAFKEFHKGTFIKHK